MRRWWLTACLALAACAGGAGRLDAPIVAGAEDSADPAIVMLLANIPGQPTAAACTGAVISPHVLLTAGHCVSADSVGAGANFYVFTSTLAKSASPNEMFELDEVHAHPMFRLLPLNGGNDREPYDIAVGILKSASFAAPPVSYNHSPLDPVNIGRAVRVIGYGVDSVTDAGVSTAGTRRVGSMSIAGIDSMYLTLTGDRNSTCHGDSGGPALLRVAGREAIVGVTSVGPETCDPSVGSIDTNSSSFTAFIDGWVDPIDPRGQAPVGAPCGSNRDCASSVCGQSGGTSYCSQACDPSAADVCPAGYPCSDVDGEHFCAPPHHGCDVAAGAAPTSAAWMWLLALAYTLRKVRAAGRPKCKSSTRTASIIERMPQR